MALDADREWDFPSLPFVEKRAISIFQLCSAGQEFVAQGVLAEFTNSMNAWDGRL